MKVSLMIIARNEEKVLPALLENLRAQTFSHDQMEVILVDSASTDATKDLMKRFAEESDFANVQVLDNPKQKLAFGWNIGIRHAKGDILMRVDAHAGIPENFVDAAVACIESGEDACGGPRPNVLFEDSAWGQTLLEVESSAFGSSIAPYRNAQERRYVDSIFHGAYRREVFDNVGLLHEGLGRTEDNEFHYRLRQAGYQICMDPTIRSEQHVRPTFRKMLKQKYGNGRWIGLTLGVSPKCLKLYHFAPGVLVVGLLGSVALLPIAKWPAKLAFGGYAVLDLLMSGASIAKNKRRNPYFLLLPFLFPSIHIAYGIGTLVGCAQMPFLRKSIAKLGVSTVPKKSKKA